MPVRIYGRGWGKKGEYAHSPAEVFSRSQINLGIGSMGFSEELTNVKARDFDVSCTGGGVYLTTYNPDLAMAFEIGKEILCYRNREEAIEMAMYYLDRPDECRAIAKRARERCLREHQWSHRFLRLCRILRIIHDDEPVSS
jgi:spore maturation protein CgeB